MNEFPFLDDVEEAELFERDYPRYPRKIAAYSVNPPPERQLTDLQDAAAADLLGVLNSERGFKCHSIAVAAGDGCSWAATAIDRAAADRQFGRIKRLQLKGLAKPNGLPQIVSIVGLRAVADVAQKYSLVSFAIRSRLVTAGLIVGAIVLGVLATAMTGWLKSTEGLSPAILVTNPPFLIAAFSAAAIGLASQYVLAGLRIGSPKAFDKLADELPRIADTDSYSDLVDDIAERLGRGTASRCLIVDGYDKLDSLTQMVLRRYIIKASSTTNRSEVWIILDRAPRNDFRKRIEAVERKLKRRLGIKFDDLVALGADLRARLAEEYDHPERATFEAVGSITRDVSDSDLQEYFESKESRSAKQTWSSFELFYLLAMTATWSNTWAISERFIEENFIDPKLKHARSTVLRQLLPDAKLGRHELHEALRAIRKEYGNVIHPASDGGGDAAFEISGEAGAVLSRTWDRYHLADPRLCHLFWSLFWHDKLVNHPLEPYWIEKLSAHILSTGPLREIGQQSARVASALFDAILFAVERALKTSQLGVIPELLERALVLIDPADRKKARGMGRLLRKESWEAYAVIGDDAILQTISTLDGWLGDDRTGRGVHQPDPLEVIFKQSIGVTSGAHWDRDQGAVRLYGRLRALWLMQMLKPFVTYGMPKVSAALGSASSVFADAVSAEDTRLIDPPKMRVVNYLIPSLLLWCMTLDISFGGRKAAPADEVAELISSLETIVLRASQVTEAAIESNGSVAVDLPTDAAATELIVLVRLCAAALTNSTADLPAELSRRARELATWAMPPTDTSKPDVIQRAIQDVEQRLDLNQVMWAGLGFSQLASFSRLRRAQLPLLPGFAQAVVEWRQLLNTLWGEINEKGYLGLAASAIAARAAQSTSIDVPTALLSHGVSNALKGGIVPPLSVELCYLMIRVGHGTRQNLDDFLEGLLASEPKRRPGRVLGSMLTSVPDAQVPNVVRDLLHVMERSRRPNVVEAVESEMTRRVAAVADENIADQVQEEIDLFSLGRRFASNGAVDIDATIGQWKARRNLSQYDQLLYDLIVKSRVPPTPLLLSETSGELARRADDSRIAFTSPIHLARGAARAFSGDQSPGARSAVSQAMRLLERHIAAAESSLTIEAKIDAYDILRTHNPSRRNEYFAKLLKFEVERHERDELAILPALLERGSFFLIFLHYFEVLRKWGLRTDIPEPEMTRRLQCSEAERSEAMREWQRRNTGMPPPIVVQGSTELFGGDFLWYGHCIFSPPGDLEPGLKDLQAQFDDEAQRAMPTLFAFLCSDKSIPLEIRDILARHQRRMSRHTLPD